MGSVPRLRDAPAHSGNSPERVSPALPGADSAESFLYSAQEAWAQLAAAQDAAAQEAWAQLAEFHEADAQLAFAQEAWAQLAEFHEADAQLAFAQEALFQLAWFQEALADAVLAQLAESNATPPALSGPTKSFSAALGFGGVPPERLA